MSTYHLIVVTPERVVFDGEAQSIVVRTICGDIGILKGHSPYVSPLSIGRLKIVDAQGGERIAAVAGGMLRVSADETMILTDTCEWAEEISVERAKEAELRAKEYLEHPTELHTPEIAEIKLQRALNRIKIAEK